ncbi:DUF3828 domain-containing protein [Tellurirhabdus rosea]|uniref:DUF3828 domain-containing protein n=1 Tax=Tellurirhabdus rosea TaxID=2674997 RepID=UPI002253D7E4|nr:DUF3828 domain-containing protein [Tellurirhabdus rosea]
MKHFTFLVLLAAGLLACQKKTPNSTLSATGTPPSDSAAIAQTVHGFYKWYIAFSQDSTKRVDFTEERDEHLALNQPRLERYFAHFKASGFVSDEFIAGEYAFYRECSQLWQAEAVDDVPSCLDADKYFCAQDWDPAFWTDSPVRLRKLGPDKVLATLFGNHFDRPMERNIELKRENGRWRITRIECDMGLGAGPVQLKSVTVDEAYVAARTASRPDLSEAEFTRLQLGNIIPDDLRQDPHIKIVVLDTLLANGRNTIVLAARDSDSETEAWLVQYDNTAKMLFWDQVFYADRVEYLKTISAVVSGNGVAIKTTTETDGRTSEKAKKYVLSNALIFERD